MVSLDTIKHLLIQQMLNWEISLFCLAGCVPLCLKSPLTKANMWPPPPSSVSIREHQVQPKLFLWEYRMCSFSIQSVSSLHKSLLHSTFLPEISAEIHLAVRKQLLFVEGSGWCNFNFKDVLNELPLCDWWAVRNLPPIPPYTTIEGFNYEPLVLMLSAAVWYASYMWGEWILPPGRLLHTVSLHTMSSVENALSSKWSDIAWGSRPYVFTHLFTLTHSVKWIWFWLMNNHAWSDLPFNQYLLHVCPFFMLTIN